jgi:HSP20 family protein
MPRNTDMVRHEDRDLIRRTPASSPFRALERFADEMESLFEDFGLGPAWRPRFADRVLAGAPRQDWGFSPQVEIFHRNNELVVRADLPGLTKDDVKVDVAEDRITLSGERRQEHKEEHEGIYRSERSYGAFHRVIPLPPGTISDQAKATFRDGVLEVTMPAPPESARHGRRLEIAERPAGSTSHESRR